MQWPCGSGNRALALRIVRCARALFQVDAQATSAAPGEDLERFYGGVALAVFYAADDGLLHAGFLGQLGLGESGGTACTALTPMVFCTVTAVITDAA